MVLMTPPPLSSPTTTTTTQNASPSTKNKAMSSLTPSPSRYQSPRGRRDPAFVMSPSCPPPMMVPTPTKNADKKGSSLVSRTTKTSKSLKPYDSTKKSSSLFSWLLGHGARCLLLDLPLLACFAVFCGGALMVRLRDEYWTRQYEAEVWAPARWRNESTYFNRQCLPEHQTAFSMEDPDMVFQSTDTAIDAKRKVLTHGATLYPGVLSPETAHEVREFIVKQNQKGQDMIRVIANENRYSFGIQVDQHPAVAKALTEVLTNQRLVAALEEIIGPDPSVIEFTGITSTYGAEIQNMHADVIPQGSAQKFSRNFVPSYSLFIPLQNTTAEMGATYICPGTHQCTSGADAFCDESAVQASGPDNNWPAGWGALVNQQTMHKGGAHVDPDGPDRVLFILTFAPRPRMGRHEVETRILGSGGSYSLHWSQWSHTLADFANPLQRMKAPYRHLKALGLYKAANQNWGWDFWTVTMQRIAQSELGYSNEDFFDSLWSGVFDWVPQLITGPPPFYGTPDDYESEDDDYDDDETSAWKFFAETVTENISSLATKLYQSALSTFVGVLILINLVFSKRRKNNTVSFFRPIRRVALGHVVIALLTWLYFWKIEQSTLARNLRQGFAFNMNLSDRSDLPTLPSTLATEKDVIDTSEYQSSYLGSYTELLDHSHSGNILWKMEVEASFRNYDKMPFRLQTLLCQDMVQRVGQNGGRFLTKNIYNEWSEMSQPMAMDLCDMTLKGKANPVMGNTLKWIKYLTSEWRFGYWRNTRGLKSTAMKQLKNIQSAIVLKRVLPREKKEPARQVVSMRKILLPMKVSMSQKRPERHSLPPRAPIQEPYPGAWVKVGDFVEGQYASSFDEWYQGTIVGVSSFQRDSWHIEYLDGEIDKYLCRECVRLFVPFAIGEQAACHNADERTYLPCEIVAVHSERKFYDVVLLHDRSVQYDVAEKSIRRGLGGQGRRPWYDEEELDGESDANDEEDDDDDDDWEEGTRVMALYPGALEEGPFPGVVAENFGNGEYRILYDDGDVATVHRRMIVDSAV